MSKSILSPDMKGVMFISGYRGKGKTFLAAHADLPDNIAFFDFDEGKAEGLHKQLKFGYYKPVEENEPLKRADMFLREVENLVPDKYTVAIIDNILPLEKALQAAIYRDVKKYSDIYGYTQTEITTDHFGKARGIMNDLIGDAIAKPLHAKGIKLIIVTSHVKEKYKTPGKMIVQGKDRWQDLSILTLILVNGDNPPIPSAIVQKEALGNMTVTESDEETVQAIMRGEVASHTITPRLPARFPEATWQAIRRYLYEPVNLREPAKGEKLIPAEVEPFDEILSKEQVAYQLGMMEKEKEEKQTQIAAELFIRQSQEKEVRKYLEDFNGLIGPAKMSKLKAAVESGKLVYDGEITISKINKWSETE